MVARHLALNCSLALRDVAPHERAVTAAALDYAAVEFWWPFAEQSPEPGQMHAFVEDVRRAELPAVLLNLPGGGPAVQDRGLLSVPGREEELLRAAETAVGIGRRIGTTSYNPMAGNIPGTWQVGSAEFETALANLLRIAPLAAEAGASIVLEPLSGFPRAALQSYADARTLVLAARAEGAANVSILFDLFHLATTEDPVLEDVASAADLIGHVQIADAPGRGWPGSGHLPLKDWIGALRGAGYGGMVGVECVGERARPAGRVFG